MTELFNYFLINLLGSFILKIYTCKPLKGGKYYSEYVSPISIHILPIDV